jgi:hypothetical protein
MSHCQHGLTSKVCLTCASPKYGDQNINRWEAEIDRFAALVAAAEREACAKVCDDWPNGREDVYSIGVAIRARG